MNAVNIYTPEQKAKYRQKAGISHKLKFYLEYANGGKFSISNYCKELAATQDVAAWKKEYGDFWHIEYKKWMKKNLVQVIENLDLVITS